MPFFRITAKVEAWSVYIVEAANRHEAHNLWADDSPASRCIADCEQDPTGSEELYSNIELEPHEADAEKAKRQLIDERRELDRMQLKQMKLGLEL
jgi:hypothetical protein